MLGACEWDYGQCEMDDQDSLSVSLHTVEALGPEGRAFAGLFF